MVVLLFFIYRLSCICNMKVYIRDAYNKIAQKILNFLKLIFCKIFKSLLDKAWIRINNKDLEFDKWAKKQVTN